jgi:hypothetical protein
LKILKSPRPVRLTERFEKAPAEIKDLRTVYGTKHFVGHQDYPHYTQVFESHHGFIPCLSILDVIFNLGPEAPGYLDILK